MTAAIALRAESKASKAVELAARLGRRPVYDRLHVALDVGRSLIADNAFEHVEAMTPIGLDDVFRERTVRVVADAPAVQGQRSGRARFRVGSHRRLVFA